MRKGYILPITAIIIALSAAGISYFGFQSQQFGAPISNLLRSVVPETDNRFYIGTTSPANLRFQSLILATSTSGCASFSANGEVYSVGVDCGTGAGAGAGSDEFIYGTNVFNEVSFATSTNAEINGTGTSTFAGGLEAWRQIASPYFHATSTTATSTFSGDAWFDRLLRFSEIVIPGAPVADKIQLYASDTIDKTRLFTQDSAGVELTLSRDNVFICRNNTGVTITKGSVVYINGQQGNSRPTCALADADSETTLPAAGVAFEDISNNGDGYIMTLGSISGIATSGAGSAGDLVYVSQTAGEFTGTRPSLPALTQTVGVIINSHASNGSLEVNTPFIVRFGLGTSGSVAFFNGDGLINQDNANFFWDDTNNRLGIASTSPGTQLSIGSTGGINFLSGASATSTIPGHLKVGGNLEVTGNLFAPVQFTAGDTTITGNLNVDGTTRLNTGLTGLSLMTSGTISAYGGTSCTNQFPRSLNASGAATCASVSLPNDVSTFSSADLAGRLTDETGTGVAVFGTAPTFTTSLTSPLVIGGTAVGSSLSLRSTSGVGTTDHIKFQVGNNGATEAMRVANNGYLGIGVTNPLINLVVGGTPAGQNILAHLTSTAGGLLQFTDQTVEDWAIGAKDGGGFGFFKDRNISTAGTEIMTMTANGLGIGTSTVALAASGGKSLDVNGPVLVRGGINNHQTSAGAYEFNPATNLFQLRAYGATAGTGLMTFSTGGGGGSTDTERVRIAADGKVGISDTSPEELLDIGGNVGSDVYVRMQHVGGSLYRQGIKMRIGGNAFGFTIESDDRTTLGTRGLNIIRHENSEAGASAFWITRDNGNVGIGVTTPQSALNIVRTASADDVLLLQDSSGTCEAQPTTTGLTWSCSSDERIKEFITPASKKVLEEIINIPLYEYTVKDTGEKALGPIAQRLIGTPYEYLVSQKNKDHYTVSEFTPWQIVKGIQELYEMIVGNTKRIEELEREVTQLKHELAEIKARLD
jgi:hypothetical protein